MDSSIDDLINNIGSIGKKYPYLNIKTIIYIWFIEKGYATEFGARSIDDFVRILLAASITNSEIKFNFTESG